MAFSQLTMATKAQFIDSLSMNSLFFLNETTKSKKKYHDFIDNKFFFFKKKSTIVKNTFFSRIQDTMVVTMILVFVAHTLEANRNMLRF